jgi:hypothetical protein
MAERSYNGRVIMEDKIAQSETEAVNFSVADWMEDESLELWYSRDNSATAVANFQTINGEKFAYIAGSNNADDGLSRGTRISKVPILQGSASALTIADIIAYGIPVIPGHTYRLTFDLYFTNDIVTSGDGRRIIYRIFSYKTSSTTATSVVNQNVSNSLKNVVNTITVDFTAPAGAEYITTYFQVSEQGAGNLTSEAYFKEIKIEEVTPARLPATTRSVITQPRVVTRDMGTALGFDGVDDYVEVPDASIPATTFQNGFTLSAWINNLGEGPHQGHRIFQKASGITNVDGFALWYDRSTGNLRFQINNGTQSSTLSFRPKTGFYNVVATVESNATVTLFVNSVPVSNPTVVNALSQITTTLPLRIGNRSNGTDRPFNGIIDEPRIWSRALTAQEVSDLYYNKIVPRDGLVAEYLFDEASGTTALDTSGNGNHGTITGATYTTDVPLKPRSVI